MMQGHNDKYCIMTFIDDTEECPDSSPLLLLKSDIPALLHTSVYFLSLEGFFVSVFPMSMGKL